MTTQNTTTQTTEGQTMTTTHKRPGTYTDGSDYDVACVALDRLRKVFESASLAAKLLADKVRMQRAVKVVELQRLELRKLYYDHEAAMEFGGTPDIECCKACGAVRHCEHSRG